PMIERRDLIATRPKFLARLSVEGIQHRVSRGSDPSLRLRAHRNFDAIHNRIWKVRSCDTGRRFGPSLFTIFTAAVRENDSIRDDGWLRHIHVTPKPRWFEHKLLTLLEHFESGNGAVGYRAVLNGVLVLRMLRPPEGRENPARSFGVLPARHRTPHTC